MRKVYGESTSKTVAFDAMLIKKRVEERAIEKVELENRALSRKVRADFNVGEGEAEAIALCIGSGSGLITDDKKAMNACRLLGIKFTTAPNLLVAIYKSGLVTKAEANAYMGKLQKAGRYSDHIARQLTGELK